MSERVDRLFRPHLNRRTALRLVAETIIGLPLVIAFGPHIAAAAAEYGIIRKRPEKIGGSYSYRRAENYGLDWQAGLRRFLAMHPDMVRISCYWNDMEPSPGKYDFTILDRYYEQIAKTDVPVIQVQGMKGLGAMSRDGSTWQEFFIPEHLSKQTSSIAKGKPMDSNPTIAEAAQEFTLAAVEYAENNCPNLMVNQVENEGPETLAVTEGKYISKSYMSSVTARLKSNWPERDILVTNSSSVSPSFSPREVKELSFSAGIADWVGQNFYIVVPNGRGGVDIASPLFFAKLNLQSYWLAQTYQVKPICSEAQFEPWFIRGKPIAGSTNPDAYLDLVLKAGGGGYKDVIIWGVEHAQSQSLYAHNDNWERNIDRAIHYSGTA